MDHSDTLPRRMSNLSGNTESIRSAAKAARGFKRGGDTGCYRRIVISLDDETFETVAAMAARRGRSFALVARELIEFGLIDAGAS